MKKHDVKGLDISLMRPFIEGLLKNMEGGVFTVDTGMTLVTSFLYIRGNVTTYSAGTITLEIGI